MSESDQIDIHSLHAIVLRETESDSILEIEPDFYRNLSNFIGNLKKQEFDGIESKIKQSLIEMTSELTALLLNIRLEKTIKSEGIDFTNLLDEEKFILDAEEQKRERTEMILSATINGKSKFLESISQNHKTKTVVLRILQNVDEIVGADLEKYGPFKPEDIATLPYENAQALITKKVALGRLGRNYTKILF
jgi:DNA replication factor GINS